MGVAPNPPRSKSVELAKGVTIAIYERWVVQRMRQQIADFVYQRFSERYLIPALGPTRHGFAMMAIACLMIEALESFKQGWPDTRRMYYKPFQLFFGAHKDFAVLEKVSEDFYRNIRCGILHQAEAVGGWRIRREGPLFAPANHTINAALFLRRLHGALREYRDTLCQENWDSQTWMNLREKMRSVCDNAVGVVM